MADLTPYLSGDAVKDYPNLANFPTLAWQPGGLTTTPSTACRCRTRCTCGCTGSTRICSTPTDSSDRRTPTSTRSCGQHFTRPDRTCAGMGVENNVGMGVTNGWLTGHLWRAQRLGARRQDRQADRHRRDRAVQGRRRLRARPVGRGRLPPQCAAVQPGQRAQRLRRAARSRSASTASRARRSPSGTTRANARPAGQAAHHDARSRPSTAASRPTGHNQRHPRLQRHQAGAAGAHQRDAAHPQLAGRAAGHARNTCS